MMPMKKESTMDDDTFIKNNVIYFFGKKKDYQTLSNFYLCDIIIDGIVYESGEHAFHGEKYRRLSEVSPNLQRQKVLFDYSKKFRKPSNKSCIEIKRLGGKKGLALDSSEIALWTDISIDVQNKISAYKLENYEEVRNDLIRSESKLLVHTAQRCSIDKCNERFWEGKAIVSNGEIKILGKNMLGNIWMNLRSRLF
jgi:predicted NAD-dependent protein-ADP-ribosyltransferase YbiA (DUF1768 family)